MHDKWKKKRNKNVRFWLTKELTTKKYLQRMWLKSLVIKSKPIYNYKVKRKRFKSLYQKIKKKPSWRNSNSTKALSKYQCKASQIYVTMLCKREKKRMQSISRRLLITIIRWYQFKVNRNHLRSRKLTFWKHYNKQFHVRKL